MLHLCVTVLELSGRTDKVQIVNATYRRKNVTVFYFETCKLHNQQWSLEHTKMLLKPIIVDN